MQDMHEAFWDFDVQSAVGSVQVGLVCREQPAFPDKCGNLVALPESKVGSCEVRRRRAVWALELKERYAPRMVEWIDSGEGREKAVGVLTLELEPGRRLLVVCFRGSKALQAPHMACALRVHCVCTACALRAHCVCTACALRVQDYTKTDVSLWFTPVSPECLRTDHTAAAPAASATPATATANAVTADAATAAATAAADGLAEVSSESESVDAEGSSAFLTRLAASSTPCVTVGLWCYTHPV